jgi:L-serine dehydratase
MYRSLADAIRDAEARGVTLSQVALEVEAKDQGRTIESIRDALRRALVVMREAVNRGMVGDLRSASELVGGDAAKLRTGPDGPLANTPFRDVLARAIAVQEVNAAMGVIVAAPTAGGAGVLPAVLTGLAAARGIDDERVIDALATAGLIGAVVADPRTGGCHDGLLEDRVSENQGAESTLAYVAAVIDVRLLAAELPREQRVRTGAKA